MRRRRRGRRRCSTLLTFLVVTLTWIPFRSPDPATAHAIFRGLFASSATAAMAAGPLYACLVAIALTVAWHWRLRDSSLEEVFGNFGELAQAAMLAACLIAMFLYSGGDERAFIYFQF